MAITFPGSASTHKSPGSSSVSFLDGNHTTTADTDLLLACWFMEGAEDPEVSNPVRFDIASSDQSLTLIRDTGNTASNGDVRALVYGLVSPGEVSVANCRCDHQFSANPLGAVWVNVAGVDTASVAAATNYISEVQNTSETGTSVLSSGGSSGNALLVLGGGQGSDMSPASVSGSFSEIVDDETGTDVNNDLGFIVASLTSGLPSGATITWGATDENSAILIELVEAGGGGGIVQQATHHYRNSGKIL